MSNIVKKYSKLHEECKKYPRIQLGTRSEKTGVCKIYSQEYLEYLAKTIAEDGFIETFCLDDEQRSKVRSLRYEENQNRRK